MAGFSLRQMVSLASTGMRAYNMYQRGRTSSSLPRPSPPRHAPGFSEPRPAPTKATGPRHEPCFEYEIPTHRINKVNVGTDVFEAIHSGEKKFYIDRVSYKKGHYILFREYDEALQEHTGRGALRLISWICDDIRYMAGGHTCYSLADADEAKILATS